MLPLVQLIHSWKYPSFMSIDNLYLIHITCNAIVGTDFNKLNSSFNVLKDIIP